MSWHRAIARGLGLGWETAGAGVGRGWGGLRCLGSLGEKWSQGVGAQMPGLSPALGGKWTVHSFWGEGTRCCMYPYPPTPPRPLGGSQGAGEAALAVIHTYTRS